MLRKLLELDRSERYWAYHRIFAVLLTVIFLPMYVFVLEWIGPFSLLIFFLAGHFLVIDFVFLFLPSIRIVSSKDIRETIKGNGSHYSKENKYFFKDIINNIVNFWLFGYSWSKAYGIARNEIAETEKLTEIINKTRKEAPFAINKVKNMLNTNDFNDKTISNIENLIRQASNGRAKEQEKERENQRKLQERKEQLKEDAKDKLCLPLVEQHLNVNDFHEAEKTIFIASLLLEDAEKLNIEREIKNLLKSSQLQEAQDLMEKTKERDTWEKRVYRPWEGKINSLPQHCRREPLSLLEELKDSKPHTREYRKAMYELENKYEELKEEYQRTSG